MRSMAKPHASAHTPHTTPTAAAAPEGATLHTLDELGRALGAPSPEVVEELFEGVSRPVLVALGQRAESGTLYAAVPGFAASVRDAWNALDASRRHALVGYAPEMLPVLVADTLGLRALHQRYVKQESQTAIELTRRREAAHTAFTRGRLLRDQAARLLRRVTRGSEAETAALDASIGSAESAATLADGLTAIADEIDRHRAQGSDARKRLLDRVRLDATYTASLRAAAKSVTDTDAAASAAASAIVSQEDLDAADGRVLHVADWIYRAFKEASELDDAVRLPDLGDLATWIAPKRSVVKPPANPAKPA